MTQELYIYNEHCSEQYCIKEDYVIFDGEYRYNPPLSITTKRVALDSLFGGEATIVAQKGHSTNIVDRGNQYYGYAEFSLIIIALLLYSMLLSLYRGATIHVCKALIYPYVAEKLATTLDINIVRYIKLGAFSLYLYIAIFIYGLFTDDFNNIFNRELLLPIIFASTLLYALWRRVILLLIAYLASNWEIASRMIFIDNLSKSAWVVVLAPIALLSISSATHLETIFEYIGLGLSLVMFIHLLYKQMVTFNLLNISFFQYILYLCATEFIPISSIYVIITRVLQ